MHVEDWGQGPELGGNPDELSKLKEELRDKEAELATLEIEGAEDEIASPEIGWKKEQIEEIKAKIAEQESKLDTSDEKAA